MGVHWPVYQMGGQSGSGMLLSTKGLVKSKVKSAGIKEEPGRENFSLGGPISLEEMTPKQFLAVQEDYEKKLIGWLQVRDPNNKKFFTSSQPCPRRTFPKSSLAWKCTCDEILNEKKLINY